MKKQKLGLAKKSAKLLAMIWAGSLFLYLALGLWLGSGVIWSDLSQKCKAAASAVNVVLQVYGPPVQPLIGTSPGCLGGAPYIALDWADDAGVTSFDVYRDGLELVTGLETSEYRDDNVDLETSYMYYVVARGPLGEVISETVMVTAPENCEQIIDGGDAGSSAETTSALMERPKVNLITLEDINLLTYAGIPETTRRAPVFSGTSSAAGLLIIFEISGQGDELIASTTANENGYWYWVVPRSLHYGKHLIRVTARDSESGQVSDPVTLPFIIKKKTVAEAAKNDEEEGMVDFYTGTETAGTEAGGLEIEGDKDAEEEVSQEPIEMGESMESKVPFYLALAVSNAQKTAFLGDELDLQLLINVRREMIKDTAELPDEIKLIYKVMDADGRMIFQEQTKERGMKSGAIRSRKINKLIPIGAGEKVGRYSIQVETIFGDYNISSADRFYVKERPVLDLGGGVVISSRKLMNNLGWLMFVSFGVLNVLGLLLLIEHRSSVKAALRVTGQRFRGNNLLTIKRKE